jgi:predicted CXXCH cytochrome family protein
VEGCVACHTPHGSVNRHMLHFQSTADLCFSCHVDIPGFHARFNRTTNCVNCHSAIHGSQMNPFFLR